MRTAAAVGTTAILILVTEVWGCAARAEDAIKPGKWKFWTVAGQKIPPGTQLPPEMRWGPEGVITSVCVPETKLKPPDVHKRVERITRGSLGKGLCDTDATTDATTGARRELVNCAWSSGATSSFEMAIHFHGDTLDGTTTNRFSLANKPATEHVSVVKGRYVGPCDARHTVGP